MKHSAPPVPAGFSPSQFFEGVHWHQGWDVFEGVRLPGRNSVEELCQHIQLPVDLMGKRVLDIGAWNGAFSFECERRGASETIAFSLENPETSGFNRLKSLLNSQVKYVIGSVYNLHDYHLGKFDIVLFLGVLYHLRYPLLAIDRLRSVCAGEVFIESHIVDELAEFPIWRFYPGAELANDPSNWFGPNVAAVVTAFETAGFEISVLDRWGNRASFKARPNNRISVFANTYEGQSHELRSRLNLQDTD